MPHERYDCLCCSPFISQLLKYNRSVAGAASVSGGESPSHKHFGISRRSFNRGTAALVGGAFICTTELGTHPAHAQDRVARVFTGGTILTVDGDFSEAEAIAIRGNEILAVGDRDQVRNAAGPGAELIDLDGRVMLPGFIDPHTHMMSGSLIASLMEYVGVARFSMTAEVVDYLRDFASTKTPGEWVVARNFDPSLQEGPEALTFAELDSVSTDHPVFVLNSSGHLAYANRAAFKAAGIGEDVKNPEGAEFVRDSSGNLSGTIKNNVAFLRILEHYPALSAANPIESLIQVTEDFSKVGLTTLSDLAMGGLYGPLDWENYQEAGASGRLTARMRVYPIYTVDEMWDEAGTMPGDGDALVRVAGFKLLADGSNQGFTGLQREPYLNSTDTGLAYLTPEELKYFIVKRGKQGWPLAIHGNGDKAIDNILDALQAANDEGIDLAGLRPRIEHCSILHDDQISRIKNLGVSPSFLIGHVHYWGVAMRDEVFGEEKAMLLDRCRSVEEAGIGFTIQSDFFVTDPDPLHMIEMAVTRRTWKEPEYVLAPDERISVESAIRALTSEAAWQLGSEHEVGSLEPGKLADFVILDKDPRKVDPDTIKDIKVLQTWMDGKPVFQG
ncbi:amidohydrolase [Hoeflea sp. CAU 1731]